MWSLCHVGGRALQDYLPDGVKTLTVMKKRLADLELDSLKENHWTAGSDGPGSDLGEMDCR